LISSDVTANMGAFALDTSQIGYMLRHCSEKSLCLIDEVGKIIFFISSRTPNE
jgi:DNA mismatch repair ATPase MutS